jgi:hypothetical protein
MVITNDQLTEGQKEATRLLLNWLSKDMFYPTFSLTGKAGTGKTTVINNFLQACPYGKNQVVVTAPTHKAKTVIFRRTGYQAETIQKLLGLRPDVEVENYDPNKPVFNPMAEPTIKNYKLVIIDEASMIASNLYNLILEEATAFQVKVLFLGDSRQLFPVGEDRCVALLQGSNYDLKEVVRQNADNPVTYILNLLADDIEKGTRTFDEFRRDNTCEFNYRGEGFQFTSDINNFCHMIKAEFQSEAFQENTEHCKVLSWQNARVEEFNRYVRSKVLNTTDSKKVVIGDLLMGYKTIVNEFNEVRLINSEEYSVKKVTESESSFNITGDIVHLTSLDKPDELNTVFIVKEESYGIFIEKNLHLLNLAKEKGGKNAWKKYSDFKNGHLFIHNLYDSHFGEKDVLICKKDLDYGFALTVHKSQGSTYENVFVDLRDINKIMGRKYYQKEKRYYTQAENYNERLRLLYVALSRAEKRVYIFQ